jgi:murein DD-endopeptidase MepM/ murein hydrolase activator NlpD
MEALIGPGGRPLAQYLDDDYMGYDHAVAVIGRGKTFVRHTGRDFWKAPGTPVRALTSGRVTGLMNLQSPVYWHAAIVHDGGGTWWAYGHLNLKVRVGEVINRGEIVGTIADPKGAFTPHVHVSALRVPYPTHAEAINDAIGWGRSYGRTAAEAKANALRYTDDPLDAFARIRKSAC